MRPALSVQLNKLHLFIKTTLWYYSIFKLWVIALFFESLTSILDEAGSYVSSGSESKHTLQRHCTENIPKNETARPLSQFIHS
jgi:hypothetical protein